MTTAASMLTGSRRVLARDGLLALALSARDHLNARLQLRRASRVGSVRLRGRALVKNDGRMVFGDRLRLWGNVVPLQFTCFRGGRLEIGEGTFINHGSDISAATSVTIGGNCNIGQFAIIIDSDFHDLYDHQAPGAAAPVIIEDDVWLAARVTVLRGSRIGRGSVIGAHAVVSGEIPPYSLAVGVPAKVIRSLRPGPGPAPH